MTRSSSPTRRGVLGGLATLPVLGSALAPGAAYADAESRSQVLAQRLRELELPYAPARLDLLRYSEARRGGEMHLRAVIRLTWAPGYRSRVVSVRARGYEAGHDAVLGEAYALFVDPN